MIGKAKQELLRAEIIMVDMDPTIGIFLDLFVRLLEALFVENVEHLLEQTACCV